VESIMSSKLFTTRQGTVLLGVIAAVIAAIALLVYLNHYRNSHGGGGSVSVLVAQKLILQGTPGDVIRSTPGYYKPTNYTKSQVESGSIVNPATLVGQVVTVKDGIAPGQPLLASDFGPATNSITEQLPRNERAVVVQLTPPEEVGGQIDAGSHVDVWVAFNGQQQNGISRPVVRELFQNMSVLNATSSGGNSNVTLEATSKQAGTLIYATQNATIWLVLRPTIGSTDARPPVIAVNNLLGSAGLRLGR
jgi:Flp pilus assembly protein CpaB